MKKTSKITRYVNIAEGVELFHESDLLKVYNEKPVTKETNMITLKVTIEKSKTKHSQKR